MIYRWLADAVVVIHVAFVAFVMLGALAVLRWPRLAWLHIPAALWGVFIEWSGRICPLTPLENALRMRAGEAGYSSGFIDHYILPALYPAGLTRTTQLILGASALALNLAAYTLLYRRWRCRPPLRNVTAAPP
jgi:Protein of Unknown function (DUF2784)